MRKNISLTVQRGIHNVRGYFHPAMLSSYFKLKGKRLPEDSAPKHVAIYDFYDIEIDAVMGRYLFHLVKDLLALGYSPVYTDRFKFLASFHKKRYKQELLELPLHTTSPNNLPDDNFIYITDHPDKAPEKAELIIRINYEHRRAKNDTELEFPFFAHPQVSMSKDYPLQPDILSQRAIKLLFAGNTRAKQYTKGNVKKHFQMIPRNEVLDLVKSHLTADHTKEVTCAQDLQSPSKHIFHCVESSRYRIPADQWIPTLQQADFFLCCPGVAMPLCHNLIESLACGTIPILQYGHFVDPHLVSGVNCLSFHDRPSLVRAINLAATMPESAVRIMRENVLAYYRQHCAEGRFAEKLLTSSEKEITVLLNAYRVPRPAPKSITEEISSPPNIARTQGIPAVAHSPSVMA